MNITCSLPFWSGGRGREAISITMSALSAGGGSPAVALAEGEIFEDDEGGGVVVEGELRKLKPHQKRVGVAGMEFLATFLARRGKRCMASAHTVKST